MRIPDAWNGQEIIFRGVSGDCEAKGVALDRLDVTGISGDIVVEPKHLKAARLEAVSGDVTLRGQVDEPTIKTVSGEIEFQPGRSSRGPGRIQSVSGDINAAIKNVNAQVEVKTLSGDVFVDGKEKRSLGSGTLFR